MLIDILKKAFDEDESTKVLVASILVTGILDGKLRVTTQVKVCLKLLKTIVDTCPQQDLKQVVMDYIVDDVMKMQEGVNK